MRLSRKAWLAALAAMASMGLGAFAPVRAQGISWPQDQVLPHFTAAPELDVIDISGMAFDRKVAFTTLQGLINRTRSVRVVLEIPVRARRPMRLRPGRHGDR